MARALGLAVNGSLAVLGGLVVAGGLARAGTFSKTAPTTLGGGSTKTLTVAAASVVVANAAPAITYQALPMVDPATNKPVLGTTKIKGTDGNLVTAQAYYDKLNGIERHLSDRGLSLRTLSTKPPRIRLERSKTELLHQEQLATRRALSSPISTATKTLLGGRYTLTSLAGKSSTTTGKKYTPPKSTSFKTIDRTYFFSDRYGSGLFSVDLSGSVHGFSTKDRKLVDHESSVTATVFGTSHLIARTQGKAHQVTTAATANVICSVMGSEILSKNFSATVPFRVGDTVPQPAWRVSLPTFVVPIGPVNLTITVGAEADYGVEYGVDLQGDLTRLDLAPDVSFLVDIALGVGVAGFSVGVGGKITVIGDTLQLASQLQTRDVDTSAPKLVMDMSAGNTLHALDGTLYAHVTTPFGRVTVDLFDWTGVSKTFQIFGVSRTLDHSKPDDGDPIALNYWREGTSDIHHTTTSTWDASATTGTKLGTITQAMLPGQIKLYACYPKLQGTSRDVPLPIGDFVSKDATCDGQYQYAIVGFAWPKDTPGKKNLRTCRRTNKSPYLYWVSDGACPSNFSDRGDAHVFAINPP